MLEAQRTAKLHAPGPLRAPTFWAALALLVLNDHVLKGSGLLPGALTGKLSDFAGLIVAPVVAAELCRGPLARVREAAAAAVVLVFVATELSPACARAIEGAAAALGFGVRLWPDPTDLLALAVLPWTFRLLGTARPGSLAQLERMALAGGALACLATSDNGPFYHGPFLVNHSGGVLEARARWFEPPPSCSAPLAELAEDLEGLPQPQEHALRLQLGEVADLSRVPDDSSGPERRCPTREDPYRQDAAAPPPCVVLVLEAGGAAHLVRARRLWTDDAEESRCAETIPIYEQPGQGALVAGRGERGELELIAHENVEVLALP